MQFVKTFSADPVAPFTIRGPDGPHRYPNLVYLVECNHDPEYIYSVMEYIDGMELFDYVDERGSLTESEARFVIRGVLEGLKTLHSLGISHRDMSLENLMITPEGRCVIIDYGMALRSALHPESGEHYMFPCQGQCGKRNFMAPEVVANDLAFTGAFADMWAMGVILFMLLTGIPPVDFASALDPRFQRIANGRLGQMLQQWDIHLSPQVVDLLTRMLRPGPLDRLTISQILEHPWMQGPHVAPPPLPDGDV